MAAPTATPRPAPTGIPLDKGYQVLITIAADTDICFWEKTITPPSLDGGDPLDITTQHNTAYKTKAPRALVEVGETQVKVLYDPALYTAIKAVINVRTTITVEFPDGSTLAFYGYVKAFEPDEMSEENPCEATVTIVCTNYDPVNHVEAAPVLTSVAGT